LSDLEAITELRLQLLREELSNPLFARPHRDAPRRALRLTRSQLATPGQVFLVATRGETVVGVLRCRAVTRTPMVEAARQAVVTTAYVVPAERRKGVLRALVRAADRWCAHHSLTGMRLQCGLANEAGRAAWEKLGFIAAEVLYVRDVPRA
jgi:GNAT superfamily N-acetyltransferase